MGMLYCIVNDRSKFLLGLKISNRRGGCAGMEFGG